MSDTERLGNMRDRIESLSNQVEDLRVQVREAYEARDAALEDRRLSEARRQVLEQDQVVIAEKLRQMAMEERRLRKMLSNANEREQNLLAIMVEFKERWPQVYEMIAQKLGIDRIRLRLIEREAPPTPMCRPDPLGDWPAVENGGNPT